MQRGIIDIKIEDSEILANLRHYNELIFNNPFNITSTLFLNAYDCVNIFCSRAINNFENQGQEIYQLLKEDLTSYFIRFQYENITSLKKQIIQVNLLGIILKKIYSYLELYYIPMSIEFKKPEITHIDTLVYERFYSLYLNKQCNELFIESKLIRFIKYLLIKINNEKKFIKICNDFILVKKEECFSLKKLPDLISKANEHLKIFNKFFDYDLMLVVSKKYVKHFEERLNEITGFLFKNINENKLIEASKCYNILKFFDSENEIKKWSIYVKMQIRESSNFLDFLIFSWVIKYVFEDEKEFYLILQDAFKICKFNLTITKKFLKYFNLCDKNITKRQLHFIKIPSETKQFPIKKWKFDSIYDFLKDLFKSEIRSLKNLTEIFLNKEFFDSPQNEHTFILHSLSNYAQVTIKEKESFLKEIQLNLLNGELNFATTANFIYKFTESTEFNTARAINDLNQVYKMPIENIKTETIFLNSVFWDFIKIEGFMLHERFLSLIKEIETNSIESKMKVNINIIESKSLTLISINEKKLKTNIIIASIILFINEGSYKKEDISLKTKIPLKYLNTLLEQLEKSKIIKIGVYGIIYVDDLFENGLILNLAENMKEELIVKEELVFLDSIIVNLLKKHKEMNKIELFEKAKYFLNDKSLDKSVIFEKCKHLEELGYLKEEGKSYIYIP